MNNLPLDGNLLFKQIRDETSPTASTIWKNQITPALDAYERLRGDAVSPEEIAAWRAQYAVMKGSKSRAAAVFAVTSRWSAEAIRRHL